MLKNVNKINFIINLLLKIEIFCCKCEDISQIVYFSNKSIF